MQRRLIRTVPGNVFYSNVVHEALAMAAAYSTGGVDAEMRGAALRQQRGTRRERLGALRDRLEAQQISRRSG